MGLLRWLRTDCRAPMPNGMTINGEPLACTLGRWHEQPRHVHHKRAQGGQIAHAEWETPRRGEPVLHSFEMQPDPLWCPTCEVQTLAGPELRQASHVHGEKCEPVTPVRS